jgi:hypothetical protein
LSDHDSIGLGQAQLTLIEYAHATRETGETGATVVRLAARVARGRKHACRQPHHG